MMKAMHRMGMKNKKRDEIRKVVDAMFGFMFSVLRWYDSFIGAFKSQRLKLLCLLYKSKSSLNADGI